MRTDFSIRRLLMEDSGRKQAREPSYHWLASSRYNPPKLARLKKSKKRKSRKSGHKPRVPFSSSEIHTLEQRFQDNPYLSSEEVAHLSSLLRIPETRVKIWFQNRRAREKRLKGNNWQKQDPVTLKETSHKIGHNVNWSAFQPVHPSIICNKRNTENTLC